MLRQHMTVAQQYVTVENVCLAAPTAGVALGSIHGIFGATIGALLGFLINALTLLVYGVPE